MQIFRTLCAVNIPFSLVIDSTIILSKTATDKIRLMPKVTLLAYPTLFVTCFQVNKIFFHKCSQDN